MSALLKPIFSLFISLAMFITGFAEPIITTDGENCKLINDEQFYLFGYLLRTQDVTTDGDYYYFSSNFTLLTTTLDGETVKTNYFAIPLDLLLKGLNHIGGISYANGKIYAAVENNPGFKRSCIIVYDAQTLKPTGQRLELDGEVFINGIPWLACDPDRGVLYAMKTYGSSILNAYKLDDLSYSHEIELSFKQFSWIQGGDMYDGKLYISCHTQESALKYVWCVDVETGACEIAFKRNVGDPKIEAEGMTVLPTADGALFHVLDAGKLKINVHFRHYSMLNEIT